MEVQEISYRTWQVVSESDTTMVTWNPRNGFFCETCGKKMCSHKRDVINRLHGGHKLGA